jgi:AraC-like DNA-binding protein
LVLKGGKPGWLDLFSRFKNMVTEYHTQSRNAQDYASRLGVSYKHLSTICKYATGDTPKSFIDDYLILEIKRQLSISDLSIKELTYHFNFDEPTNFLKFFKKHTGLTPSRFRNSLIK